jgi:hypothetical protein
LKKSQIPELGNIEFLENQTKRTISFFSERKGPLEPEKTVSSSINIGKIK